MNTSVSVFIICVWLVNSEALNLVTSLGQKVREGQVPENRIDGGQGGGGSDQGAVSSSAGPQLCICGVGCIFSPALSFCVTWGGGFEDLGCVGTREVWSHFTVLVWPPIRFGWVALNEHPCVTVPSHCTWGRLGCGSRRHWCTGAWSPSVAFEARSPLLLPGPGIIPSLQMKQPRLGLKDWG